MHNIQRVCNFFLKKIGIVHSRAINFYFLFWKDKKTLVTSQKKENLNFILLSNGGTEPYLIWGP